MNYPCAKFGDFSFSRFGFIVRTDRITNADDRYTDATIVGVSNNWPFVLTSAHTLQITPIRYQKELRRPRYFTAYRIYSGDYVELK